MGTTLRGLLFVAAAAAFAAPAAALEPDPPGGNGPGPEASPLPSALRERALASSLVVLGRPDGVRRCNRDGVFTGLLRIRVRVDGVLKGVLGPVLALQFPVDAGDLGRFEGFLETLDRAEPALFLLFLDEVERYKMPPLYRLSGPPEDPAHARGVIELVRSEVDRKIRDLGSPDRARRDSAFKGLVALGTPAIESLDRAQRVLPPAAGEEARLAGLSIRDLLVDPFATFQPNRRYPFEPIPVFTSPECKDILFRLPPGTPVFRLSTWTDGNRYVYKVRTAEGREGWITAETAEREDCETWR